MRLVGDSVYWLEARASEGGRNTLLRATASGSEEITPAPYNLRSRVHEYGGGAYCVTRELLVFSHFASNQLFAKDLTPEADGAIRPLGNHEKHRYADFVHDKQRARIIGVREDHTESDIHASNSLCALALDGSGTQAILAEGHDFYSSPKISPDGKSLVWLTWDHPHMPWQGTQLWCAEFAEDGSLLPAHCVAGSASESICQPEWSPAGELFFVSDRSGWWNLYRLNADQSVSAIMPMAAEFGAPHWTFGDWMYGFLAENEIACTYIEHGICKLARLTSSGLDGAWQMQAIPCDYSDVHELAIAPGKIVLLAAAPTIPLQVLEMNVESGTTRVLASSIEELPATRYLSVPRDICFPSEDRQAYGMFYAPKNEDFAAPAGTTPPLLIFIHGGPTGMASNGLRLAIQFWTSRGFAVLDVNYAGSSGYGRAYRDSLAGQWGVFDVQDCVNGARYLVEQGEVDGERLIIRGGSAGGFTTLCALIFHDVFKVGASLYGVSDLASLDEDSHKFESHYNEYLIGPRAQAQAIYLQRSPIHHINKLKRPMIFLQGLDDKVVPPPQSEKMVAGLRAAGVPVAYIEFEGEGHSFRKAENIQRSWEAELYFYAKVFGINLAEQLTPVQIDNL